VLRLGLEAFEATRVRDVPPPDGDEGGAELSCEGEAVRLAKYETALVAGGAGAYRVRADGGGARLLRSSVPTT